MNDTEYYPLTLTLEAPVLTSSLERDANSARSLPYISGSALRGAVARALGDPDGGDAGKKKLFHELVLSGRVCYLNAYPVGTAGRSVPTPGCYRGEKYGDGFHDLSAGEAWPPRQLQRIGEPFMSLGAEQLRTVPVQTSGTVHHQRVRGLGRATADGGAMFYYEALDAGQVFGGLLAIRGADEAERGEWQRAVQLALGEKLWLGRSRRAGYGGAARLTWQDARTREAPAEHGLVSDDLQTGETFRALLTSDYLGRDATSGQMDPSWFEEDLITQLGGEEKTRVVERHWDYRPVGAFNRKWKMEVPQVLALQAGSVLVLKAEGLLPWRRLAELERRGLGERRSEGFGRVLFLNEGHSPIEIHPALETARPTKPGTVSDGGAVRRMEARLLRRGLDHQIALRAEQIVRPAVRQKDLAGSIPPPSLLGRLRTPLRSGLAGVETLREWLGGETVEPKLAQAARVKLEACRGVGGESLAHWLQKILVADAGEVARLLEFDQLAEELHIVNTADARQQLADFAEEGRWQLVDSVLALLARKARQRAREVRND